MNMYPNKRLIKAKKIANLLSSCLSLYIRSKFIYHLFMLSKLLNRLRLSSPPLLLHSLQALYSDLRKLLTHLRELEDKYVASLNTLSQQYQKIFDKYPQLAVYTQYFSDLHSINLSNKTIQLEAIRGDLFQLFDQPLQFQALLESDSHLQLIQVLSSLQQAQIKRSQLIQDSLKVKQQLDTKFMNRAVGDKDRKSCHEHYMNLKRDIKITEHDLKELSEQVEPALKKFHQRSEAASVESIVKVFTKRMVDISTKLMVFQAQFIRNSQYDFEHLAVRLKQRREQDAERLVCEWVKCVSLGEIREAMRVRE